MFAELPTDLQRTIFGFMCPPDWVHMVKQYVVLAEEEFVRKPSRLDVWCSFDLYDAEQERKKCCVADGWIVRPTIVVERATWDEGLTYKLGLYSENADSLVEWNDDGEDHLAIVVDRTWSDREEFLEAAGNLLQFLPRQIKELPKLACSLHILRYDKYIEIANLRGTELSCLQNFSDPRGAEHLLKTVTSK